MNIEAYARAKDIAITSIGKSLNVDLSREALPKSNEQKITELFMLQKIALSAESAVEGVYTLKQFLAEIQQIRGIGESTYSKIEKALGQ